MAAGTPLILLGGHRLSQRLVTRVPGSLLIASDDSDDDIDLLGWTGGLAYYGQVTETRTGIVRVPKFVVTT